MTPIDTFVLINGMLTNKQALQIKHLHATLWEKNEFIGCNYKPIVFFIGKTCLKILENFRGS